MGWRIAIATAIEAALWRRAGLAVEVLPSSRFSENAKCAATPDARASYGDSRGAPTFRENTYLPSGPLRTARSSSG